MQLKRKRGRRKECRRGRLRVVNNPRAALAAQWRHCGRRAPSLTGGGSGIPVELTAGERRANENSVLHPTLMKFPLADTRVVACQDCGVRLLAFGAAVHCHEHHSGNILGDLDSGVEEMMIEKMEIQLGGGRREECRRGRLRVVDDPRAALGAQWRNCGHRAPSLKGRRLKLGAKLASKLALCEWGR